MDQVMEFLNAHVLPHWPFIAWAVIAMVIGQVMVKNIFTKKHAETLRPKWLWYWARKTLPLHPVLSGIVIGIFWRNPEPAVMGIVPAAAYFGVAGALSLWLFEVLRRAAAKRGVVLALPGQTVAPGDLKKE
ncbi:hypothetical protein LCGC14_0375560 [marine sediment metagenome]|uniref:Uncharacterized protein n=1 Tax=marine sediment metagenome TaxID=412755 RepID=A0A0F9T9X5_9ZZZZ